ncbi:MAG: BatD family protein, partial [Bdellovibrionales bacterium]
MKQLLLLTFFIISTRAFATEVQVNAVVDRNQVGMGDVINLTVQVTSSDSIQIEEPKLPPLSGFELINTSSSNETRSSFINGKFQTSQTRNFIYMLAIQQKGILTLPEIPVTVEGKVYKTQPIKISATSSRPAPQGQQQQQARRGGGQAQGQQQDPFQEMDDMEELFNQMLQRRVAPRGGTPGTPGGQVQPPANPEEAFFISAETDKTKAYVGEQITVGFYLYTRGQIRDIDTLKYPDLKSFWKEEIEMATRLNFEQVNVNGIVYSKALLVSYALFPIKAGKSVIDPYKAKCTVVTPSNFGFGRPYQFTKASRAINIEVMDVPANGRPANYSGAVGRFRLSGQFEPPTGTVNQPVTLRLRFEGQGNAKLIELPKLELPPSFEFYDQKNSSKFLKDGTSFKEFEVLIIPREPGVFNLTPVTTSVFDPATQKYTAISTQPLNITITGSATSPAAP